MAFMKSADDRFGWSLSKDGTRWLYGGVEWAVSACDVVSELNNRMRATVELVACGGEQLFVGGQFVKTRDDNPGPLAEYVGGYVDAAKRLLGSEPDPDVVRANYLRWKRARLLESRWPRWLRWLPWMWLEHRVLDLSWEERKAAFSRELWKWRTGGRFI